MARIICSKIIYLSIVLITNDHQHSNNQQKLFKRIIQRQSFCDKMPPFYFMKLFKIYKFKQPNRDNQAKAKFSNASMRKSVTTKEPLDFGKVEQPIFMQESLAKSDESSHSHASGSQKPESNNGNTLAYLTRKFVHLMKQAPGMTIQIQEASQQLGIQKRRIYDITNVLEGIGYIQKLGKNLMKWVGGIQGSELQRNLCEIQAQITLKVEETRRIQQQIDKLKLTLIQDSNLNNKYNYLQPSDVTEVMQSLGVDRLLIYTGSFGDQIQCDSNPQNGVSTFVIESLKTGTTVYYCSHLQSAQLPRQLTKLSVNKEANESLLNRSETSKGAQNQSQQLSLSK